jgi:hypothetical protein
MTIMAKLKNNDFRKYKEYYFPKINEMSVEDLASELLKIDSKGSLNMTDADKRNVIEMEIALRKTEKKSK